MRIEALIFPTLTVGFCLNEDFDGFAYTVYRLCMGCVCGFNHGAHRKGAHVSMCPFKFNKSKITLLLLLQLLLLARL